MQPAVAAFLLGLLLARAAPGLAADARGAAVAAAQAAAAPGGSGAALGAEIVVTGRALPGPAPIAPVGLLDSERLEVPSRRLDVALQQLPQLGLFRRASSASASQTAQGLFLRGLGGSAASRLLVLLDGVPQADLFAGWVPFVPLSAAPLESARLETGAGGARLFGGMAPAGVLLLQSAPAASDGWIRAGSRKAAGARARLALPVASGTLQLYAAHEAGAGHLLVRPEAAGPADVPARYRQEAAGARMVAPLSPATELQARLAAFSDRRRRGTAEGDSLAEGADAALRLVHRGAWGVEAVAFAQLRDFAMRAVAVSPDRQRAGVTLDQFATPAAGWGAGLLLRPPVAGGLALALGADWREAGGEAQERFAFAAGRPQALRTAGGRQREASVLADLAAETAGGLSASLSARLVAWRLSRGRLREVALASGQPLREERAPDRAGTEWAGALGLAWRPPAAEAFRVHALVSRGVRLPTLNELHRPFRVGNEATAANPLLRPERLTMAEAGLEWQPLPTLSARVVAFEARLSDAVANVTIGEGPGLFPGIGALPAGGVARQRRNIAALRSEGVEARAAADLGGPWAPRLEAALALADAEVEGGPAAPGLDGLRPAQVPRISAAGALVLAPGPGWRLAALVRHQSARFEDDRNLRRLAPATVVDLSARVPLAPGLALIADLENAGDATVETGLAGGLAERAGPRAAWVGLAFGRQGGGCGLRCGGR